METVTKNNGSSACSCILVVTTIVLTLLLTITVSAVIYLSVWQQNIVSHLKNTTPEFVRHGSLRSGTEGEKKSEEISFYKEDNVVVYKEKDGSFGAQDFNKGIYYKKDVDNGGRCYLVPVPSTSEAGREFENFLAVNDAIRLTGNAEEFEVLKGEITDTSFIPIVVQYECYSGYSWLAKSSHKDHDILKRSTGFIIVEDHIILRRAKFIVITDVILG